MKSRKPRVYNIGNEYSVPLFMYVLKIPIKTKVCTFVITDLYKNDLKYKENNDKIRRVTFVE